MADLSHSRLRTSAAAIGSYIVSRFSIDTRTLAVFRVLTGFIIIGDILARAGRFRFFYTEDGVVPQWLAEQRTVDHAFSIFFYTTNTWVIAALFLIHGLIAIQLIIGYRTTFATFISFVFVISLDHHNPLILSYADTLFRLILIWAILLPLGERWSVDAVLREREPRLQVTNLASAAILLQVIYMYFANGLQKSTSEFWTTGIATPLVFGLDDMTYFLAEPLRNFPGMLQIGGYTWYYMLLSSWLLLFLPGFVRIFLVAAFVVAHLSFAVTVRIGGFAYVALSGVILFLQSEFWDLCQALARRFGLDRSRLATQLAPVRTWLIATAGRFPKFPDSSFIPAYIREGIHAAVATLGIITILLIPPLAVAHEHGHIDYDFQDVERSMSQYTRAVGLRQPPWTVFAPTPRSVDRYYVFAAVDMDDNLYDVYNDRELTFDRPYHQLQRQYQNYRERFYMNSVRRDSAGRGDIPRQLGDYLCRTWDEDRGIQLRQIDMWSINERITLETIKTPEDRRRWSEFMFSHSCGDFDPVDLPEPTF